MREFTDNEAALSRANEKMVKTNKKLTSTNDALKAEMAAIDDAVKSLLTEIEDKAKLVGGIDKSDDDPIQRLSTYVDKLLAGAASNGAKTVKNSEANAAKVKELREDLMTASQKNSRLQSEVIKLQEKIDELQPQKKEKVKTRKQK
ncbi:hypothetical protein AAVH_28195 [Aphelenchoides avenae]|nr:hypothetical protein AAVH_28195 [Aphelenchus avenae]